MDGSYLALMLVERYSRRDRYIFYHWMVTNYALTKDMELFMNWMINPRWIVEDQIGIEKAPLFAEWAWGPEFKHMIFTQHAVNWWNERHGDKLKLSHDGNVEADLMKMIELWKCEKGQN